MKDIVQLPAQAAFPKAARLLKTDEFSSVFRLRPWRRSPHFVLYGKPTGSEARLGLVIGKKQYVEWVKLQSGGIGRAMKVGKEGILGLTQAIESYLTLEKTTGQQMVARMTPFLDSLNTLTGVSAKTVWDSAGRDIARAEITFDEAVLGRSTYDIVQALKTGDIAIYFRGYKANEGKIEVDVRSVDEQQLMTVFSCIKNLFTEKQA